MKEMTKRVVTDNFDLKPDAVVLGQGEYPKGQKQLQLLHHTPNLVICDGASKMLAKDPQLKPTFIIGDGDSISPDVKETYADIICLCSDQETNDQTKAVMLCKENGWRRVIIMGATGYREDHTIGNVALLNTYREMGMEVYTMSDYGTFFPVVGELELHCTPGRQLSFFALTSEPFSVSGVLYPFTDRSFKALWEATLNQAVDPIVKLSTQQPVLVYVANEIKPSSNQ